VILKQALAAAIARLTAQAVPSPRLNAETLLMFTLGCDRAYLFAHSERELNSDELGRYEKALAERASGVPAQYITGHQEFWGLDLIVSPAVLIPRPETEHVIECVLHLLKQREPPVRVAGSNILQPDESPLRIADVGTGSGCIALALAKELPQATIDATDISASALQVAGANAARHQMQSRVHFHQADLMAGLPHGCYDFVVSNPPYVGESEEDAVQLEVRKFEPRNAVFAGPKGSEVIELLIPQAYIALKPGGWLVLELSATIAQDVSHLLRPWAAVCITPDLQGIPRVICAQRVPREFGGIA
jgi:release factor glutamine methyltransferase